MVAIAQPTPRFAPAAQEVPTPGRFAVVLNPHARHVSDSVLARVHEVVDPDDVYVTRDLEDASRIAARLIDAGYETVFTAGGDGTVTSFINHLPDGPTPRIGILPLGTGNAMAEMVSSGNPLHDLQNYTVNPSSDSVRLGLCESEGQRFAFAGLGLDAEILNHYRDLKSRFGSGPLKPVIQHLSGYLLATFGLTVPSRVGRWLKREKVDVRIVARDEAYRIDARPDGGHVGKRFRPGDVIYEGPVNTVAFGTCPFYGYRMKMLPYAGVDPRFFHLRVSNVPAPTLVRQLHRLWDGTLFHPEMHEFHARDVHIEFSAPQPYQVAGEAMGHRRALDVSLSERPVDLVRFI